MLIPFSLDSSYDCHYSVATTPPLSSMPREHTATIQANHIPSLPWRCHCYQPPPHHRYFVIIYILITSFPNANTQQIIMPWLHQCHSVPTTQLAPFTIKHECNDNMPSRSLHRHRRTIKSERTTSTVILSVIILSAFAVILSAVIVSVIITTRQSKHASLSTSRRRMGGARIGVWGNNTTIKMKQWQDEDGYGVTTTRQSN